MFILIISGLLLIAIITAFVMHYPYKEYKRIKALEDKLEAQRAEHVRLKNLSRVQTDRALLLLIKRAQATVTLEE
jgi:hypothetical protein